MTLKTLLWKEFTQIRRNAFLPRVIFALPIGIICIFPWVANMEVTGINVCIVDNDHSSLSTRLTHRIESSTYFNFLGMADTYAEGLRDIEKGKADLVAVIPKNYGRDIAMGKLPQIFIAANSVNGTKGSLGSAYVTNIIMQNLSEEMHVTASQTAIASVEEKVLYNPYKNFKVYMIPALMTMIIIMICGFLPSLNIVGEKEVGTIEQINVTPVTKWDFILAKLIPYWIFGAIDLAVSLVLSWLIYDIAPSGNVGLIFLGAILLAITFSSIGIIISNYSDTMQQAMFIMWFVLVCLMLLSGLFTPIRSMPDWSYILTYFNPVRYFIDLMRAVFVQGTGFSGILLQFGGLTAFSLVMGAWAVVSYRKNS